MEMRWIVRSLECIRRALNGRLWRFKTPCPEGRSNHRNRIVRELRACVGYEACESLAGRLLLRLAAVIRCLELCARATR